MIGNAHIDPVWLWRWQEGVDEALATFRSAADRCEEYHGSRRSAGLGFRE
jgi:alpha-mannosidase